MIQCASALEVANVSAMARRVGIVECGCLVAKLFLEVNFSACNSSSLKQAILDIVLLQSIGPEEPWNTQNLILLFFCLPLPFFWGCL